MTDELFPYIDPHVDRLGIARRRYEAATFAYDEAVRIDEECDGFGIVPDEVKRELLDSEQELRDAEMERLKHITP